MMSDEEKRGDIYVRHQPTYRSEKLGAFLDKLDERSSKKESTHAKYKRAVGTPLKKNAPSGIDKWMMKSQDQLSIQAEDASNNISSSESEHETDNDSEISATY